MNNESLSKITIVIPCFNDSAVIDKAINSALAQSLKPFEILIIDDGSDEDIQSVLGSYNRDQIKYCRKEHTGLANTRNYAIEKAKGDYVTFLDSDDILFKNYISKINEIIKNENPGLIHTGLRMVDDKKKIIKESQFGFSGDNIDKFLLQFGNYISVSGATIQKKCFQKAGMFYEDFNTNCACEDWDMWIRIANRFKVSFIRDILVKRTFNPTGPYIRGGKGYKNDLIKVIKRGLNNIEKPSIIFKLKCLSHIRYLWANVEFKQGSKLKALQYIVQALLMYPLILFHLLAKWRLKNANK